MTQPQAQQGPPPLSLKCGRCEERIVIGPNNCVAYIFIYQLYFSKINVICPHCEFEVFLFATRDVLAEFLQAKVGQIIEKWADEETIAMFEKVHEVQLPRLKDLSWRQIQKLKYAQWELENTDVLDELE